MTNQKTRSDLIEEGIKQLKDNDPILFQIIKNNNSYNVEPHTDYYHQLVSAIIGQQLSVKAAAKIKERFLELFSGKFPTPESILKISDDEIRAVGFSRPKVGYIKDLAQRILDGRLEVDKLPMLDNEDIIKELTAVKGIGEWTAHMFLIFSLGRLDVLALGDFGVRMAIKRAYDLSELPSPHQVIEISEVNKWHPYESIACWYMWRSLNNEPVK